MTPVPSWLRRADVLAYVIDAYAGVEETRPGIMRRLFLWEAGDEVLMGNAEAFVLHLIDRFDLPLKRSTSHASSIHRLLRALGEPVNERYQRHGGSPASKKFKQPAPDAWAITHRKEGHDVD